MTKFFIHEYMKDLLSLIPKKFEEICNISVRIKGCSIKSVININDTLEMFFLKNCQQKDYNLDLKLV